MQQWVPLSYESQHTVFKLTHERVCRRDGSLLRLQHLVIGDSQEQVTVRLVQKHDPLLMGLPVWGEGDDLSLCSSRGESDEWEATRSRTYCRTLSSRKDKYLYYIVQLVLDASTQTKVYL